MQVPLAGVRARRPWFMAVLFIASSTGMAVFGSRPLVSYKAIALGAGTVQLGLMAASFAGLAAALAVPIGRYVDRRGERVVLLGGLITLAVALTCISWTRSIAFLAVGQSLLGAGHVAVVLGCQGMVANRAPAEEHPQLIGAYTSATSIGQVLGPALAGAVVGSAAAALHSAGFFIIAGVATAIAIGLAWTLPRGRPPRHDLSGRDKRHSVRQTMGRPGMPSAMVAGVTGLLAIDLFVTYLPAYGLARDEGPAVIGLALSALALCQLVVRFGMGRLLGWFSIKQLLGVSLVVPGLVTPLLMLPLSGWQIVAVMAVTGSALGICQPMSLALTIQSAPLAARGLAMGIRIAGNRLGVFVMPAVIGATAGQAGLAAVFGGLAGLLVAAGIFVDRAHPASGET